jgi:hypothetical protein
MSWNISLDCLQRDLLRNQPPQFCTTGKSLQCCLISGAIEVGFGGLRRSGLIMPRGHRSIPPPFFLSMTLTNSSPEHGNNSRDGVF